ncbi:MAG: hypothetical protein Q7R90_03510 [bacterium]|nr:hypothetical protein [bacterium]
MEAPGTLQASVPQFTPEEWAETARNLIHSFLKGEVPPEVAELYDIQPHVGKKGWQGKERNRMYYDTPLGLNLTFNGRTVAVVAYDRERTTITIQQLQGDSHCKEELRRLRWEKLLVEAVVRRAEKMADVREVQMTPAHKQEWFGEPASIGERTREEYEAAMKMRYDVTAKRSGFKWNGELERWVRPLTPPEKKDTVSNSAT